MEGNGSTKDEKVKITYQEIGITYRFFLGWRHATFAGGLVIIYAIVSLTLSALKDSKLIAWMIPMFSSPIGLLLLIIDIRTRDLYHAAIRAGEKIEKPYGGLFTELSKISYPKKELPEEEFHKKEQTHSRALNIFFIGSSIFLFLFSIALLLLISY